MFVEFPAFASSAMGWCWQMSSLLARTGETGGEAFSRRENTHIGWGDERRGELVQGRERAEEKVLRIVFVEPRGRVRRKYTIW